MTPASPGYSMLASRTTVRCSSVVQQRNGVSIRDGNDDPTNFRRAAAGRHTQQQRKPYDEGGPPARLVRPGRITCRLGMLSDSRRLNLKTPIQRESPTSRTAHLVPLPMAFLLIALPPLPGGFLEDRLSPPRKVMNWWAAGPTPGCVILPIRVSCSR